jgi:hypothetical protein
MHPARNTYPHTHIHPQHSGVQRLHQQASDIGDESKVHNSMLVAFNDNVDASADALREEAKHAEVVRKKTRMCKLYVCVAVEVAILVILLVVYLQHGN